VPHRGWSCIDIYDDGEDGEELHRVCEMCETQLIRYVHVMQHPDWEGKLEVGCVCAGHMEEDYEGARKRETAFKSRRKGRAHWLERRWRRSAAGNPYINANGFNVVVFRRGSGWTARIIHRATDLGWMLKKDYETAEEAALAAYDAMPEMKAAVRKEEKRLQEEEERLLCGEHEETTE
jgi:hypothetical protein